MPYWLCDQRRQQKSTPVMRFDPRFWTVNFTRPMMASVVTRGPESLRADAVFYQSDDLAGLIWDSEDAWDHPLLAYETNRDYRRLTVSFRWKSQGIMPLDAINGPTLTISGRNAGGQAKSWYVRLWNYATGNSDRRIDRQRYKAACPNPWQHYPPRRWRSGYRMGAQAARRFGMA